MNRTSVLSLLIVACGTGAILAGTAQSQVGPPKNYVSLQPTTPGTSQSGHANLSGTMTATQFVGGGAGLTNLNASNISSGTLSLARLPVPLVLSGSVPSSGATISGTNSSTDSLTAGVLGVSTGLGAGVRGISPATGVFGQTNSTSGYGVQGYATSTTGQNFGVWGQTDSSGGYGVYGFANGSSGISTGVRGVTFSTSGRGVSGLAGSTSGTSIGGYFETSSTGGVGIQSTALATSGQTYAFYGVNQSSGGTVGFFSGIGPDVVLIQNTGTGRGMQVNTASDTGLWVNTNTGFTAIDARNNATGGYSVFSSQTGANGTAVYGKATGTGGTGVTGWNNSTSTSGTGVYGQSDAVNGNAIFGYATNNSGGANGATFQTSAVSGNGVFAHGLSNTGNANGGWLQTGAPNGYGAVGFAYNTTGNSIGVVGQSNSSTGWAMYGYGNTGASGTKSFRIDHPFDPEGKYLLHYSTEMPEPQNAYNGLVTTGADGFAWVDLPNYFHEINRDFRYQLTVIDSSDDFVMAKVTKEIVDNRFQIRTSKPNVKVSWEVKAIRNDLWVRKHGAPVEVEKTGMQRGRYQHPELYGQPKERSELVKPEAPSPTRLGK